jgi:hypothetical protein
VVVKDKLEPLARALIEAHVKSVHKL